MYVLQCGFTYRREKKPDVWFENAKRWKHSTITRYFFFQVCSLASRGDSSVFFYIVFERYKYIFCLFHSKKKNIIFFSSLLWLRLLLSKRSHFTGFSAQFSFICLLIFNCAHIAEALNFFGLDNFFSKVFFPFCLWYRLFTVRYMHRKSSDYS